MQDKIVRDKTIEKIRNTRGMSARVAEACGITRMAVYQWTRVPINQVDTVAPIVGRTRAQIRPDIHGPEKRR